ncbi:hypothetical protein FOL47_006909 [Perkinsus chesapeaki]|uniref:Legumain n=1 Tax=Perkinsus chesapeaki TaxID=330153 RepID=A0A7J6LNQ7_PERCH|nr:hypothetical protein FOL47_006909 [Perkinsus chesapeaki]
MTVLLLTILALASLSLSRPENFRKEVGTPRPTNHYGVLIVASEGWDNYRHQADICHAQEILRNNGISDENIILFSSDDAADSKLNPFPGKLFNRPTSNLPGHDVREHCKVDYKGSEVTIEHFEAVLLGNSSGVPEGYPVLESKQNDKVFINLISHGTATWIEFPNEAELHKERLRDILKGMKSRGKFAEMVIYVEACESGGMFEGLHEIPGIYVVTAANSSEDIWATYCPWLFSPDHKSHDIVDGREIGTCLGDLFSVNWMEDSELHYKLKINETIEKQVKIVAHETNLSHVEQFGDSSLAQLQVTDFQGTTNSIAGSELSVSPPGVALLSEFLGNTHKAGHSDLVDEHQRLSAIKQASSVPAQYAAIHSTSAPLSLKHLQQYFLAGMRGSFA